MERILIPSTTTLSRTRGILDNFAVGKFIPIILCAQDCAIGQHDDDNEDLDLNAPLLVYNGTFSDDEDVPNDDDDLDEFDIAALRVPEPNQDDTYGPLHLGNYDTLDRTLLRDIGDAVKTTIKAGHAWRLPPEKTLRHLLGATEAYKFVGSGRRLQLHVKLDGNPGKMDWGYVGLFIGLDPRLTPDLKIQSKFRLFHSDSGFSHLISSLNRQITRPKVEPDDTKECVFFLILVLIFSLYESARRSRLCYAVWLSPFDVHVTETVSMRCQQCYARDPHACTTAFTLAAEFVPRIILPNPPRRFFAEPVP